MTEEMKPSGIAWIGDIPQEWDMSRVKYHYEISLGKMLQPLPLALTDTLEYYMCSANITWQGISLNPLKQMWFSTSDRAQYRLENGDLLVTEGGDVAVSCIWNDELAECYLQNAAHRVRQIGSSDNRFLYYWLALCKSTGYVDQICNKATIAHFTKEKFGEMPLCVMRIEEQRAIADYLDAQCAKIDSIIADIEKQIETLKQYKQSLVYETTVGGLKKEVTKRSSDIDWVNIGIPEQWKTKKIRYLFQLRDERNYRPLEEVNLISLYTDLGVVQHSDLETTTGNKAYTADGYKKVYKDDIVVNIILCWMGAIGISDYEGVTSPAYDVYLPIDKKTVYPRYYHYLFKSERFHGKCYTVGRGIMAMRWRTYSSEFKNIDVPLPTYDEQVEIATFLDKKCKEIDAIIQTKQAQRDIIAQHKKSLIYEYVTGKKRVTEVN